MFKKIIITALVLISLGIMAFNTSYKVKVDDKINIEGDKYKPIVVLELFTSQGCSSCPSADELLAKIKKQYTAEVIALSYHVDYWNYIGWEDPFSKSAYAKKQNYYNGKFRNRSNYTPQVVVNGKEHFVGSNSSKMYDKVNAYKNIAVENKIEVANVVAENGKVIFDYDVLGEIAKKQLKVVLIINERITAITKGENRNRTLKNSNIVVAEKRTALEINKGSTIINIPAIVKSNDKIELVVLLENDIHDITGATKVAVER